MKYSETEETIQVISEYWKTKHEKRKGGALSSIIFKKGSAKNILVSPITSYFRKKEGPDYICYQEDLGSDPLLSVSEKNGSITVESSGVYISSKGNCLPVQYKRRYTYREYGLIDVHLEMECLEPVSGVIGVGMSSFHVAKNLNTIGCRPAPEVDPFFSFTGNKWQEFNFDCPTYRDADFIVGKYLPIYLCALQRGVEGIEVFLKDDLAMYNQSFSDQEGQSFCEVIFDNAKDALHVRIEPYGCWQVPITVQPRKYRFDYYIGLPFSKGKNHVPQPHFHSGINNDWLDEKKLDILAESGIKLLRLHNDYREDGNFWRDGYYPPYDPENMKKMDKMIEEIHKRRMKIVPYFSLKEFHPDCPEYKDHADLWKRTIDKNLTVIHNYAGSGEYGAQMCLRSGWQKFRKESIDLVLSRHNFDGVYYDWVNALFCNNPGHLKGQKHTDMEEFIAFLLWTRKRVGPKGIVFIHLSGVPMMVAENIADLVITHEELSSVSPLPGGFHPETDFAGIVAHTLCNPVACREPKGKRRFILSVFLEGLWSSPSSEKPDDYVLSEMKKLSQYNLTSYQYESAGKHPLSINSTSVMASLYWKPDSVLIYLANLNEKEEDIHWKVDLSKKDWPSGAKVKVSGKRKPSVLLAGDLGKKGMRMTLPGLTSRLIEIRKAA